MTSNPHATRAVLADGQFAARQLSFILSIAGAACLIFSAAPAKAGPQLGPADVLILVNANSPVSRSVTDHYRRLYPQITDAQVLPLTGLSDSAALTAGPADEIITRSQFETLIAQPVRNYLISSGMANSIYCIITTSGMPYRIEDSNPTYANVIMPAASDAVLTATNRNQVNAASVESELTVLFQIDPAITTGSRLAIENRAVNPYQGYCSPIKAWAGYRDILTRRPALRWTYLWRVNKSPRIEGTLSGSGGAGYGYSAYNRTMSPADLYLVARLEAHRTKGKYSVFAVRDMLNRSAAVSDPTLLRFVGYNPAQSAVVIDDTGTYAPDTYAYSGVYNFPPVPGGMLTCERYPVPPGAESFSGAFNEGNHYDLAFNYLAGLPPTPNATLSQPITTGLGGALLWDDTIARMSSSFLPAGNGLLGLLTYGRNGGDGRPADYLLTGGPAAGPLFTCAPGAVFSSLESFNAVTMFTDVTTGQGKIAEFIQMGGSGAIGHAFEPERGALVQGDFLIRNLLRDENADGVADLSWVEAAYSAIPYVSWSEVVIGDPLMRLHVGQGSTVSLTAPAADADGDRYIGYLDLYTVLDAFETWIGDPFYSPAADMDQDGYVGYLDLYEVLGCFETSY